MKDYEIEAIVSEYMEVYTVSSYPSVKIFKGKMRDVEEGFKRLRKEIEKLNLIPFIKEKEGLLEIRVRRKIKVKKSKIWINCVLFVLTVFTTILAGTFLSGTNPIEEGIKGLVKGIPFSFSLLSIIGIHELGHYFWLRKEGVAVSLPYFIPVPPPFFLGTFGAIIRIKSPIEDKESLIKVGSIGPILGFLLAIPITIVGLKLSSFHISSPSSGLILGNSFIFWILTEIVIKVPDNYSISLHPVAFAGWVGFFITAINLLPIGQLDGGHISYGLFGRKAKVLGIGIVVLMAFLATLWLGWLVWASLALGVIGINHPSPINDIKKIGKKEKILGGLGFLILVMCFTPMPFKIC